MSDDAETPPDGRSNLRHQKTTRTRVDEIARANEDWRASVDRRNRRVVKMVTALCIITLLSNAVGFGLLQGQRYDATVDSCHRSNGIAMGAIQLLHDLGQSEVAVNAAKKRFPFVDDCASYAADRITWFRL